VKPLVSFKVRYEGRRLEEEEKEEEGSGRGVLSPPRPMVVDSEFGGNGKSLRPVSSFFTFIA
jgi:hypothetical protein